MMRITVDVPDAQARRLEEAARRLKVTPETLAAAALQDMVGQGDADFARIAERVIDKNRDLYRRLA
jgi:predicted transcriptional regulator